MNSIFNTISKKTAIFFVVENITILISYYSPATPPTRVARCDIVSEITTNKNATHNTLAELHVAVRV